MGDSVRITDPVTIDMLLCCFHFLGWTNSLHVCMHAAFLVALFSFLQISNLVPHNLSELVSNKVYFLKHLDVLFSSTVAVSRVYRTKTIQFHQRVLEIQLPLISNSILCPVFTLKNNLSLVPATLHVPLFMVSEDIGIKPVLASHFNHFFSNLACTMQVSILIIFRLAVFIKGALLLQGNEI